MKDMTADPSAAALSVLALAPTPAEEDAAGIERVLDALWVERGVSRNTLDGYRSDLSLLARWLSPRGIELARADENDLRDYLAARGQAHAAGGTDGGGRRFSAGSQARLLSALRRYYRFLIRDGLRDDDPTARLRSPKLPRALPKYLDGAQVERLLEAPDAGTTRCSN